MEHCAVAYEQNIFGDESEMMLQWFGSQYFNQTMLMQTDVLPIHEDSSNNSSPNLEFYNVDSYNLYESNPINSSFLSSLGYDEYQQGMECMPEDQHAMSYLNVGADQQYVSQVFINEAVETGNVVQPKGKRKLQINCCEKETNDDSDQISNNVSRKKSRSSVRAPRRAKNSKEESSQGESSSCSSEDEMNGESNANYNSKKGGKSKAGQGSATDPQSLYARKRREKINQRLRILQNLVPNGTKVDISTMLEEAVQYVKFLQMQIKLLSSDDLWMYAPLAYNGVNINIDLSICQQQC
ncbi:hypothetical protein LUZ62_027909 [Rhynchospora pubera]|uniref:BHLH domain-containing protein n=1 Tax=Rhynchospora pubera TaxID=906938 RepID=A0AAV8HKR2_9POAL|nr:hypothetical protein LUZ62_073225 [Rhynchospora pubera]KAJ4815343.1 hypothetical protein LUZ62_027909 [Rhynchospora pubera]